MKPGPWESTGAVEVAAAAIMMVWPSGADLDHSAAPMLPDAPGRFSTTTGCPQASDNFWPITRARMSLVPPPEGKPVGVDTGIGFETPDIESDHAALKAAGIDVDEEIMRMGDPVPPMFFFRDPDGNTLFITAP